MGEYQYTPGAGCLSVLLVGYFMCFNDSRERLGKYAYACGTLYAGGGRWFGLGLTAVDALDALLLMGLRGEYTEGAHWVATSLHLNQVSCPHPQLIDQASQIRAKPSNFYLQHAQNCNADWPSQNI